jgi:hypothetical protein
MRDTVSLAEQGRKEIKEKAGRIVPGGKRHRTKGGRTACKDLKA